MFFYAHAFYSIAKSKGAAPSMRIAGALLADSALTGVIDWDDLHNKSTIQAFTQHLGSRGSQLELGLLDHYELDQRSHENYAGEKGYTFSHQTQQLRELVAQACGIEPGEKAKGLAHNFIESGVDINLLRDDNSVTDKVNEVLKELSMTTLAEDISSFFKSNASETQAKLNTFTNLIVRYDLRELDGWIDLWAEIALLHLGNEVNRLAVKDALLLAVELTAHDYRQVVTPRSE